jgi:hypothetical protein
VPVVNVRIMGVAVRQCLMRVRMRVRLARRVVGHVSMPVVRVVNVGMGVHQRLVGVPMGVVLGEMEPERARVQPPSTPFYPIAFAHLEGQSRNDLLAT